MPDKDAAVVVVELAGLMPSRRLMRLATPMDAEALAHVIATAFGISPFGRALSIELWRRATAARCQAMVPAVVADQQRGALVDEISRVTISDARLDGANYVEAETTKGTRYFVWMRLTDLVVVDGLVRRIRTNGEQGRIRYYVRPARRSSTARWGRQFVAALVERIVAEKLVATHFEELR